MKKQEGSAVRLALASDRQHRPRTAKAYSTFTAWFTRTGDYREAARIAGVPVRTGHRWKVRLESSPSFVRPVSHNLTQPVDRILGRQRDLERLERQLSSGCRLLTLVGPPCVGKSRLALEFAWQMVERYRRVGGVWLCPLVEVHTLENLYHAIGSILQEEPSHPDAKRDQVDQIGRLIAARGAIMLVLDDFERLAGLAAQSIDRWLAMAPEAVFVVTSRIATKLRGEHIHDVAPLTVPEITPFDRQALLANDAVRLFLDRARERTPLEVDDTTLSAVARIVRRLDGIPFAIELAAVRTRLFSPAEILTRLDRPWELLKLPQAVDARHATMLIALEWSWKLLSLPHQRIFIQCAVFVSGFDVEAAEAVIDSEGLPAGTTLADALEQLIDHSLLRCTREAAGGSGWRLDMYEIVSQFARDRLYAWNGSREVERRHAMYYLQMFERQGKDLDLCGDREVLDRLHRELPNLLHAYERARSGRLGPDGPALAIRMALSLWYVLTSWEPLLSRLITDALDNVDHSQLEPTLLIRALALRGLTDRARPRRLQDLQTALEASQRLADTALEGEIRRYLLVTGALKDPGEAQACFDRAWSIASERANTAEQIRLLHARSWAALNSGELEAARDLLATWLQLQPHEKSQRTGSLLVYLGALAHLEGRMLEAIGYYEAGAEMFSQLGRRVSEHDALSQLAGIHVERGDYLRAVPLLKYVCQEADRSNLAVFRGMCTGLLGAVLFFQGDLTGASQVLSEAAACLQHVDRSGLRLMVLTMSCAVAAEQDQLLVAETALTLARSGLNDLNFPPLHTAAMFCEGHLDLLRARRALREGRPDVTAEARSRAEARLQRSAPPRNSPRYPFSGSCGNASESP